MIEARAANCPRFFLWSGVWLPVFGLLKLLDDAMQGRGARCSCSVVLLFSVGDN